MSASGVGKSGGARLLDKRRAHSSAGEGADGGPASDSGGATVAARGGAGVAHKGGQGHPVRELLRPTSLLLRLLDWLGRQVEPCLGRELVRVRPPAAVLAAAEHVRAVEGEAFAAQSTEDACAAFALLTSAVGRSPINLAGRIYVQKLMEVSANVRYRAYAHIARNPSIASVRIRAPVFIIGLPRTGSTHLQSLLAADGLTETVRMWEMLRPLPLCAPGSARAALRAGRLTAQKRLVDLLAPGWNADNARFHPVLMDGPEEEAVLLAGCGVSFMPYVCLGGVDSAYERAHVEQASKRSAFRYLRRFLQLLSTTRAAGADSRWVLKSHYNALWVDVLLAEFPDAKLVVTVRDPLEVAQSFVSYAIANLSFVGKEGSREELARVHAAAAYRYLCANARCLVALHRRLRGSGSLCVVRYETLTSEPFEAMRTIYAQFGIPLTSEALARARAYLERSPQHGYGRPAKVAVRDVGLSAELIEADFAEYRAELMDGRPASAPRWPPFPVCAGASDTEGESSSPGGATSTSKTGSSRAGSQR